METLRKYIYEGLLRGQQSTLDSGDKVVFELIEEFLKENYNGTWTISEKPNKDGLYEVSSNESIIVKNRQITSFDNGLFIWTSIKGNFGCAVCSKLKSLEGAPEKVGGNFYCNDCEKLESLKGAPKEVEGNFNCCYCSKLKSLEGAPEEIGGNFNCYNCDGLKSLKGAPKEVGDYFDCSDCDGLKSLKGAPKEVGGYFNCCYCGKAFTKDDVEKISKVNGNIYC